MRQYWIGRQAGKGNTCKSDAPVLDWQAGRQGELLQTRLASTGLAGRQARGTPANPIGQYWIGRQAGKGNSCESDAPVSASVCRLWKPSAAQGGEGRAITRAKRKNNLNGGGNWMPIAAYCRRTQRRGQGCKAARLQGEHIRGVAGLGGAWAWGWAWDAIRGRG